MISRPGRAVLVALVLGAWGPPAAAHHLGVIVPRDDEVTLGFKRVRALLKEGRFHLAARECEATPLGRRLAEVSTQGGPDVRAEVRAAIAQRDGPGAEQALMRFFLAVLRGLLGEALARVDDPGPPERARAEQALKLLAAAWRYYNLVDFTLYQRDAKAALRARLAFEDAEASLGGTKAKGARFDPPAARRALGAFRALVSEILEATAPPDPARPPRPGPTR